MNSLIDFPTVHHCHCQLQYESTVETRIVVEHSGRFCFPFWKLVELLIRCPRLLWNPKFHYCVYRKQSLIRLQSWSPRPNVKGFVTCCCLCLCDEDLLSIPRHPQTGGPLFIGCLRLLIKCIYNYLPYLSRCHGVVTKNSLNIVIRRGADKTLAFPISPAGGLQHNQKNGLKKLEQRSHICVWSSGGIQVE
jgi:hypothetical protein